jgi:2-polyprenyl-3-methyl-5-hydroxy-6-metoxy-1,4-benzoquinol methylase
MDRVLEAELMDDEQQTIAYARADFSTSNQFFVDGLIRDFPHHLGAVVDIGCGPGTVVITLARAAPGVSITAIDGSAPMVALARQAVRDAALDRRITVTQGFVPGLALGAHSFDAVVSKDLLHHLPDPTVFWSEGARLGKPGAAVYVMDLVRPSTPAAAQQIVDAVAASESPILRQDFYNSLCAAFSLDEVRAQLSAANLDLHVAMVSDRHMLIKGRLPETN